MKALLSATIGLLLAGSHAGAQAPITLPLQPRDSADYYPWIEQSLAAPTEWVVSDKDESTGVRWRLVVLRSEIYVSLFLERVTLGEEGCCMRLDLVRELDIERAARHFGMRGEISQFGSLVAVAPRAFRFQLQGMPLLLTVISSDSVRIERATANRQ